MRREVLRESEPQVTTALVSVMAGGREGNGTVRVVLGDISEPWGLPRRRDDTTPLPIVPMWGSGLHVLYALDSFEIFTKIQAAN